MRANVLTPFNLVLGILFVIIVAVGEIKDSLFGIVLVLNTLIGIVQEVRSKRALDHLALLNAPRGLRAPRRHRAGGPRGTSSCSTT